MSGELRRHYISRSRERECATSRFRRSMLPTHKRGIAAGPILPIRCARASRPRRPDAIFRRPASEAKRAGSRRVKHPPTKSPSGKIRQHDISPSLRAGVCYSHLRALSDASESSAPVRWPFFSSALRAVCISSLDQPEAHSTPASRLL